MQDSSQQQQLITCDVHLGGALVVLDDFHHPLLYLLVQVICNPALVKADVHLGPPEAPSPPWGVNTDNVALAAKNSMSNYSRAIKSGLLLTITAHLALQQLTRPSSLCCYSIGG